MLNSCQSNSKLFSKLGWVRKYDAWEHNLHRSIQTIFMSIQKCRKHKATIQAFSIHTWCENDFFQIHCKKERNKMWMAQCEGKKKAVQTVRIFMFSTQVQHINHMSLISAFFFFKYQSFSICLVFTQDETKSAGEGSGGWGWQQQQWISGEP